MGLQRNAYICYTGDGEEKGKLLLINFAISLHSRNNCDREKRFWPVVG